MKREAKIITIICIFCIIVAAYFYYKTGDNHNENSFGETYPVSTETTASVKKDSAKKRKESCAVYITGAVKTPAMYRYTGTARVFDAIRHAGGFRKDAAKTAVNPARKLVDGEQIVIPTKTEFKKYKKSQMQNTKTSCTDNSKININQASESELQKLPGIGKAKAESIIQYRKENGSFSQIEDIMKIAGIKKGIYNKIKADITV